MQFVHELIARFPHTSQSGSAFGGRRDDAVEEEAGAEAAKGGVATADERATAAGPAISAGWRGVGGGDAKRSSRTESRKLAEEVLLEVAADAVKEDAASVDGDGLLAVPAILIPLSIGVVVCGLEGILSGYSRGVFVRCSRCWSMTNKYIASGSFQLVDQKLRVKTWMDSVFEGKRASRNSRAARAYTSDALVVEAVWLCRPFLHMVYSKGETNFQGGTL